MPLEPLQLRILLLEPRALALESAASALKISPDSLRRPLELLSQDGYVEVKKDEVSLVALTDEGERAREEGLPEMRLLAILAAAPAPVSSLDPSLKSFGLPTAKRHAWVFISNGEASLTDAGRAALDRRGELDFPTGDAALSSLPPERLAEFVRRNLVRVKTSARFTVSITDAGHAAAQEAPLSSVGAVHSPAPAAAGAVLSSPPSDAPTVGPLTRELLLSKGWKNRPLRRYGLSAPAGAKLPARRHPICRLRERVRTIFVEMGFEEMEGPLAESAFWNFDALFQPQDHPARDLADTFYLPGGSRLPAHELVDAVRKSHEKGWGYSWDAATAGQSVLRTHTTAVSARTLHARRADPAPRKFFSIGKVFRNEATDYKHLAEFFQVEGIVSWEGATFGHLLGTLKSFYSKLGFEKIRFRPSFFPYTEPSLEIEVFHPARQAWMELGGAGIFRPEVSLPLCGKYPVLAWGLSLERPLMLAHQIEDIRTFYRNDLGWLRNFPIE